MRQPDIHVNKMPALDDLTKPNPLQLQQVATSDRGSCHQSQSHTVPAPFQKSTSYFDFRSAHPTGWAESISGNGVCMSVITSKMINMTARRLHRPL